MFPCHLVLTLSTTAEVYTDGAMTRVVTPPNSGNLPLANFYTLKEGLDMKDPAQASMVDTMMLMVIEVLLTKMQQHYSERLRKKMEDDFEDGLPKTDKMNETTQSIAKKLIEDAKKGGNK
jgi:DNA invertase Pin-like site-specific DNA recombinase